ncbi:MAG: hypothetical protein IJQ28_00005 [Clostridia bacterium]|nr:hypothetical protein [Clostridia bacterium]
MRKLAGFLVFMMLATTIPIISLSATSGYTETQTLNDASAPIKIIGDSNNFKNGTAKVVVEKGTTAKQLILAGYNDNILVTAMRIPVEAGEGDKTVDVPVFSEDVTMAKIFLWDFKTMSPIVPSSTYNLLESSDDNPIITITSKDIDSGGYAYGVTRSNEKRLRVNRLLPVSKGNAVTYNLNSMELFIYEVTEPGATTGKGSGWLTGSGTYTAQADGYLAIVLAAEGKNNTITVADYEADISVELAPEIDNDNNTDADITITAKDIVSGGYSYGTTTTSTKRLRTNRFIPVTKGSVLTYNLNGMKLHIDEVPAPGATIGTRSGWLSDSGTYTAQADGYLGITLAANDTNAAITAANYVAEISVKLAPNDITVITAKDIASGEYTWGSANENAARLRVDRLIPITTGSVISYDVGTMQIIFNVLENGEESISYAGTSGWITAGSGEYTVTADGYLAIILAASDNTQEIGVDVYTKNNAQISIKHASDITIIKDEDVESGEYDHGVKQENEKRLRVKRLIPITKGSILTYNLNGMKLHIDEVAAPGATIGTRSGWLSDSGTYTVQADGYLGITLAANDINAAITAANYVAEISVMKISESITTKSTYPEGHRIIKKFGGKGNDWSFVYLPDDYYTNTTKTYPFVIMNHGNGWTMNGSEEKANWTNITMYMPNTAENRANDRFITTDDSSIWYSNPTIEALLDAGYVVAGCQNYGDSLYGNDNCRNACVDFYNYMVNEYRVIEDRCYMVGASNGAMTTLNASYLLGDKLKGIILQYPLTCLKNQYFGYSNHQKGIRTAYGISDSTTIKEDNFIDLIGGAEFDPLYANVDENGVKQGYFPATKIYYSSTDVTTKAALNALPLYELLVNSGKIVEKVQIDSDGTSRLHGDKAHFDPEGYIAWFDAHQ